MTRARQLLAKIALQVGGNPGSPITGFMCLAASASTLLRLIGKAYTEPQLLSSGIIGVDDWAFKKGQSYGTILVDHVTGQVLDLLHDRQASTLCAWLKGHPEVTVVTRDRAGPYAAGITAGAPQALQVADRFHLLMNLREAAKKTIVQSSMEVKEVLELYNRNEKENKMDVHSHTEVLPDASPSDTDLKKQYTSGKVKELHQGGLSLRTIGLTLNIDRKTVRRYLSQDKLNDTRLARSVAIDPFIPLLTGAYAQGKSNKELLEVLRKEGYMGSYPQFCRYMKTRSTEMNVPRNKTIRVINRIRSWSAGQLSFLMMMETDRITKQTDKDFLTLLKEHIPSLNELAKGIGSFKELFRIKRDGALYEWVTLQKEMVQSPLKRFAETIMSDFEAVNNAVITPYSNGRVEGHVNRLKTIKRRMYGRASFKLLRQMVLPQTG